MSGQRYMGDGEAKRVHDLDAEIRACRIDAIVRAGNDVPFETIDLAKRRGFGACPHCIPASRR